MASMDEAPKRKRMNAGDRREHIIRAARTVFVAHGVSGSRTRHIAAEAGVNEALLYRHFSSKDELFRAAVIEPLDQAVAELARAAGEPPANPEGSREEMLERTRLFVVDLVGVMAEVAPLLGVMIFDGEESATAHYEEILAPVLERIGDVIRANLGWWSHREFDPDLVARFLFGAIWFEMTVARLSSRQIDIDALAVETSRMVILGLATRAD